MPLVHRHSSGMIVAANLRYDIDLTEVSQRSCPSLEHATVDGPSAELDYDCVRRCRSTR